MISLILGEIIGSRIYSSADTELFISPDQKVIYVLDVATNKLICKYILEE